MDLVHAMDSLLLEIATKLNEGSLRVTGVDPYVPMHFAPGMDANPLVPMSNPKDIATAIQNGDPRRRLSTRKGALLFLLQIEERSGARLDPEWFSRRYTDQPVVLVAKPERVRGDLRVIANDPYLSSEYATSMDEPVKDYELLSEDCHHLEAGAYRHTWKCISPEDAG